MSVPRPRSPRRVKPRRYFAAAIATGHSALCKTLFNGSFLTRIPLCGSFSRFFSPKSLFKFLLSELFCLTKKTVKKKRLRVVELRLTVTSVSALSFTKSPFTPQHTQNIRLWRGGFLLISLIPTCTQTYRMELNQSTAILLPTLRARCVMVSVLLAPGRYDFSMKRRRSNAIFAAEHFIG